MSAQKVWKHFYRQIIDGMIVPEYIPDQRNDMLRCRREAALERKLEAANRRITELQNQVWRLEAQEHNRDDGNEWEKEHYLRGRR